MLARHAAPQNRRCRPSKSPTPLATRAFVYGLTTTGRHCHNLCMPPESVSPEELADAYWGNHQRREAQDEAREPRPYDPEAGDRIVAEGDGWNLVAQKRRDDEPEEPRTGLEWGWEMVNCIASGGKWDDVWDAREEGRAVRLAPAIDRLELLELLAERAPDDDAVGFLGADALEDYLGSNPDVARVERAAQRSERFRLALAGSWFDRKLPPEDVARLRRFGGRD